jgi:hypothetical protein
MRGEKWALDAYQVARFVPRAVAQGAQLRNLSLRGRQVTQSVQGKGDRANVARRRGLEKIEKVARAMRGRSYDVGLKNQE